MIRLGHRAIFFMNHLGSQLLCSNFISGHTISPKGIVLSDGSKGDSGLCNRFALEMASCPEFVLSEDITIPGTTRDGISHGRFYQKNLFKLQRYGKHGQAAALLVVPTTRSTLSSA